MKEPKYEVNILPQLDEACGLDIHKDTIIGFISDKKGKNQLFKRVWHIYKGFKKCCAMDKG